MLELLYVQEYTVNNEYDNNNVLTFVNNPKPTVTNTYKLHDLNCNRIGFRLGCCCFSLIIIF